LTDHCTAACAYRAPKPDSFCAIWVFSENLAWREPQSEDPGGMRAKRNLVAEQNKNQK
jgi:hypothetical protein